MAKDRTERAVFIKQNKNNKDYVLSAFKHEGKYSPREVIWELSAIMGNAFVMILKSRDRLLKALDRVEALNEKLNREVVVNDYHELMIWHEAKSALTTAKLTIEASVHREETRGGHFREDFPMKNSNLNKPLQMYKSANQSLRLFYEDI